MQCAEVSAKTGSGVDDLLDKVLLESDLMELRCNPDRSALGIVIEKQTGPGARQCRDNSGPERDASGRRPICSRDL